MELPAGRTRILDLDALRGFALLGILIHVGGDPQYSSGLDHAVRWLSSVFVEMKFSLLFSFLFGYSFHLQLEAAQRVGAAFRPRMLRRLGGLFAIGCLQLILLNTGDFLILYAVVGLVLLAMRKVKDRTALGVVIGCYALVFAATVLFGDLPSHELTAQAPTTLAALLLGLVAGRRRLLADLTGKEPVLRRIQLACFPIGLLGGVVYATAGGVTAAWVGVMTAPFLTAAYGATLLRAMHSERGRDLRRLLAPAGRMALSNYLGLSVATLLIFTVGQVSPLETVAFGLGIFILQIGLSEWWLARYSYGPAEGVLRALTNATPIRYSRAFAENQ
jgi:uncharacterized protein